MRFYKPLPPIHHKTFPMINGRYHYSFEITEILKLPQDKRLAELYKDNPEYLKTYIEKLSSKIPDISKYLSTEYGILALLEGYFDLEQALEFSSLLSTLLCPEGLYTLRTGVLTAYNLPYFYSDTLKTIFETSKTPQMLETKLIEFLKVAEKNSEYCLMPS